MNCSVYENPDIKQQCGSVSGDFEPLLADEFAAMLLGGMHPKTLQRMARKGKLPAHKIGRFWYFRASELDAWLKKSCTGSAVC